MALRCVLLKLNFTMNFIYFVLILVCERLQLKTVKGILFIIALNNFLYDLIIKAYFNK